MSFFDDKQEILKVELTTYGRFLLSRGKFKPAYYAFFDDDVIYDSLYASLSESQNSTQDRIFDETPSLKPQTTYTSIEDSVKLNKLVLREIDKLKEEESQISADKNYALSLPLANSSLSSDYSPAWSLSFISGSISSSQPYIDNSDGLSGSLQPYLKVPQINLIDSVYDIKTKKNDFSLDNGYQFITVNVSGNDQYVYSMNDGKIVLSLLEANVDNLTKNFDIEIFVEEEEKILGRDETKKTLKQLNFKKDSVSIVNNILLDTPITFEVEEDENYVEYYFELTIDDEIELPPQQNISTNTYQSNVKGGPFGVDC
jgi:hypothetical protein